MTNPEPKNTLGQERSAYLLQHKDNPVAWQNWGEEAFALAKKLDRPVFVSIGYATCHWCHVMAHESFEDPALAAYLNDHFICIKVDREEYPDIDRKYQFYLKVTGQQGGWPLSVFMTPDRKPFVGGTYFPPERRQGMPSFHEVLTQISEVYHTRRDHLAEISDNYKKFLDGFTDTEKTMEDVTTASLHDAKRKIMETADPAFGGFGEGAKFPTVPSLMYLLETAEDGSVEMDFLITTARSMCTLGLADHLRGGFFRYCVDPTWQVPHFEKMLYDNALNALFLTLMFERTGERLFAHVARRALDFIIDEFATDFGMISAMDADSPNDKGEKIEGGYYLVTETEFAALSKDVIPLFNKHVKLHRGVVNIHDVGIEEYLKLEPIFEKMGATIDANRQPPDKDLKVIIGHNALFAVALATFGEIMHDEFYMDQAVKLAAKIRHQIDEHGSLFRISYLGEAFDHVTLEDYAYTIEMAVKFFEVTKDKGWGEMANRLMKEALDRFGKGGILYYDMEHEVLDTFDDATYAPHGLIMLQLITGEGVFANRPTGAMLDFAADRALRYIDAHATLLRALTAYVRRS